MFNDFMFSFYDMDISFFFFLTISLCFVQLGGLQLGKK